MSMGWHLKVGSILLASAALAWAMQPFLPAHLLIAPAATTQPSQQPLPTMAEQQKALGLIQNVFKADYADVSPHGRAILAQKLLAQALETHDDAVAEFVLLNQACDAAIIAGEPRILRSSIDTLAKDFAVDPVPMKNRGYGMISSACWTVPQAQELSDACEEAIEQAIAADEYDNALKLQAIGMGAANRARAMDQSRRLQQIRIELLDLHKQFASAKSALDRLQAHPDDARAAQVAGRFLCFVKGDWSAGLPILAHAADPALSAAAKSELSATDAEGTARAAGAWWDISIKLPALERKHVQTYAVAEYRRVAPALDGLSKTVATQRIAEFDNAQIAEQRLFPGLSTQLFDDKDFSTLDSQRVDQQVDFDWGHQPPTPSMPKEDYAIRWNGVLRISQPGLYTLSLQANEGGKLLLDGKTILQTATGTHRHTTQKIDLQLTAGLHEFQLDYWSGSGMAKCKLLWIAPGSLALLPIPPEMFYHHQEESEMRQ
ncbi:MAG TPA: PA14 domain-containing protein [Tepidisphaeraceae bacterium]|jgi:hypothetical protein